MSVVIQSIVGREILNSRGKPTVEAELTTSNGLKLTASVPSGTSTGKYEARELFDGDMRFRGFGTKKAASNVSNAISTCLAGMDVADQRTIDKALIALDGTPLKERLGGNAILAASIAAAKAGAAVMGLPMYRYLGGMTAIKVPDIASTVISGGAFSPSGLEFEDYLMILEGFPSFSDSVEALCDMRKLLEKKCKQKYGVVEEDGGALAPPMSDTQEAFETMLAVAREVGCEKNLKLGLDVAANELYAETENCYRMTKGLMDADSLCAYYRKLTQDYPLIYIEDPFMEDQWKEFAKLTAMLPKVQIVGDDLFATSLNRLHRGIEEHAANTLLMKVNQAGTVTEAIEAAIFAHRNHYLVTASLRSGETTDDFQADLAVAVQAKQMKLGSPVRGERNVKYNRLMRIEQELS